MNPPDNNNPTDNNWPSRNSQSRKGKGRQKLSMEKIANETNRQVTFSKRRAGLFKKASELSTLCGAESAVVVFSPGEKAHSFGHPNVETIADRFLNANIGPSRNDADQLLMACDDATSCQHNEKLMNIERQLELEKHRKKEHENMRKAGQGRSWCPPCIDELNYEQLGQLERSIMSFKQNFEAKLKYATSMANSYAKGSSPEAGIGEGAPTATPSGHKFGLPMGPNMQEATHFALYDNKAPLAPSGATNLTPLPSTTPSRHNIGFPTGCNMQEPTQFALYDDKAPFFPSGATIPTPFVDERAVNSNVAIPTNPGSSVPSAFPSSLLAAPFDPSISNYGFMVQYPHAAGASSSNAVLPYNFGNLNDADRMMLEQEAPIWSLRDSFMETQTDVQNKFQGFSDKYGHGNS